MLGRKIVAGRWRAFSEALAFFLELCALAALGWWGFTIGDNAAWHVLFGLGAPLVAALLWGMVAAPRARIRAPLLVVLAVKAVVYASAVAGLYGVHHAVLGLVYAALVVANTTIVTVQRRALGDPASTSDWPARGR